MHLFYPLCNKSTYLQHRNDMEHVYAQRRIRRGRVRTEAQQRQEEEQQEILRLARETPEEDLASETEDEAEGEA